MFRNLAKAILDFSLIAASLFATPCFAHPLKIAIFLPLTGMDQKVSLPGAAKEYDDFYLANTNAFKRGFTDAWGKTSLSLDVKFVDTKQNSKVATSEAEKLLKEDKPDLVLFFATDDFRLASKVFENSEVPKLIISPGGYWREEDLPPHTFVINALQSFQETYRTFSDLLEKPVTVISSQGSRAGLKGPPEPGMKLITRTLSHQELGKISQEPGSLVVAFPFGGGTPLSFISAMDKRRRKKIFLTDPLPLGFSQPSKVDIGEFYGILTSKLALEEGQKKRPFELAYAAATDIVAFLSTLSEGDDLENSFCISPFFEGQAGIIDFSASKISLQALYPVVVNSQKTSVVSTPKPRANNKCGCGRKEQDLNKNGILDCLEVKKTECRLIGKCGPSQYCYNESNICPSAPCCKTLPKINGLER